MAGDRTVNISTWPSEPRRNVLPFAGQANGRNPITRPPVPRRPVQRMNPVYHYSVPGVHIEFYWNDY